jgi:choline dehydrogenase
MVSESEIPESVDIVVIGGGTSGCACAGLLSEQTSSSILLIEAGPDYGPLNAGGWPRELLDARLLPLTHDWEFRNGEQNIRRARVIGGCSAHNGCTCSVGAREDYDGWQALGNQGWGSSEFEPLFRLIRNRFRVQTYKMDELTPIQSQFVDAAQASGLPFAEDLDQLDAGAGVGPMAANVVDGVRWNAAFAFLDPVRGRPQFMIAGRTLADRLVFRGNQVIGVQVVRDGRYQVVRTEKVVLCAGAYLTPVILMRSGIGPSRDLRGLGIEPLVELPGVGEHLLDHPCFGWSFAGSSSFFQSMSGNIWRPDEQSVGRWRSSYCDEGPYDVHAIIVSEVNIGHPSGTPPISVYGAAMRARSHGHIKLLSSRPDIAPLIDCRYLSDPEGRDLAILTESRQLVSAITSVPEFARFIGPCITDREADLRRSVVGYYHPVGTCKMGPESDTQAVVSPVGAVYGVEGVFVGDVSLMPTIVRGNTNLPAAAVAARVVASILDIDPAVLATQARTLEDVT